MQLQQGTPGHDHLDQRSASEAYELRGLAGHDVILGSVFGDLIIGGLGADQMAGGAGDDTFLLTEVDAFYDVVKGDEGFDTLLGSAANETFMLKTLASVERIDGGGGFNVLLGYEGWTTFNLSATELIGIHEIDGGAGHDQIVGSSADDRIVGGVGTDTLDGGPGTDTAVYRGNFAAYTLTSLSSGWLQVSTTTHADGTDKVRNFERLEFADGTYASGVFTPSGDPTNTLPQAQSDSYAGTEDTALVVSVANGVLGNDTDPDGDALSVSSFESTTSGGGSVSMTAAGSFNYVPANHFNGLDTFAYTVADGRGGFANAVVSIDLAAVNDAPNAVDNSYSATQNGVLTIAAGAGVLANDSDADAEVLGVASFDAISSQGGSVAMNSDGSFTYTPPADFTGTDTFSYAATDGNALDAATVTVDVRETGTANSQFEGIIGAMPENEWVRLNTNEFRDVWTPVDQRPYHHIAGSPAAVINAWGAATWDSNRDEYIIWGGGHANYEGNEVYTWSAATLQWERASLPSEIVHVGTHYETVDGWEHSPISSHAWDNLEFLQVADRMINFGGSAAHHGSNFVETDRVTKTGPYFWDPAKADPDKVGGLTGSHVNPDSYPDVVGGEMWENRMTWNNSTPIPGNMTQGTTDYALIDGVDVVFVNTYSQGLFKYSVYDVNDPSRDTWEHLGRVYDSYSGHGGGAYDPVRNMYVRTSGTEFTYWDLDNAGPANRSVGFMPEDPSGQFALNTRFGMEYDPVRDRFVLWEGNASVWYLQAPDEPSTAGWQLQRAPTPTEPAPVVPTAFTGVNGRWDYIDKYDLFIGVTDAGTGDIWAYKPEGWTAPDWMV